MSRPRKTRSDLPRRVYAKHGTYYFVDKTNKWHRLGTTIVDAMTTYADLLASGTPITKMGQLFDRYQREVVPEKATATQAANTKELALLRQAFGHMRPEQIKSKHAYAYMDARKAPIRANREKALLSHVFKKAIRWGVVESNPCKGLEGNPEKARDRYIEHEEFLNVYDMAPPVIQVAMLISLLTGLRQGDVLSLSRQHLTDEGIKIKTRKTGRVIEFEWADELRAVVNRARGLRGDVIGIYLVCRRDGQRYTGSGFRAMWNRVMRRCVRRGGVHFTFQDIRAKAGSDTKNDELLGHFDGRTMRRHYKRKPIKVKPLSAPLGR